ncbi:unnamed protein product, partial [Amoebophrya sp. A120]
SHHYLLLHLCRFSFVRGNVTHSTASAAHRRKNKPRRDRCDGRPARSLVVARAPRRITGRGRDGWPRLVEQRLGHWGSSLAHVGAQSKSLQRRRRFPIASRGVAKARSCRAIGRPRSKSTRRARFWASVLSCGSGRAMPRPRVAAPRAMGLARAGATLQGAATARH